MIERKPMTESPGDKWQPDMRIEVALLKEKLCQEETR